MGSNPIGPKIFPHQVPYIENQKPKLDFSFDSGPNYGNQGQERFSEFTKLESQHINGSWSEGLCRNFTDEELYRFFEVIDDDKCRMCFQFMAFMGLRIGEAVRVNAGNINWKNRRFLIENIKARRVNHMFLHDLILDLLVTYMNKYRAKIRKYNGHLIFSENRAVNREYISDDYMRKCFRWYCEDAGLDDIYAKIPSVGQQVGKTRRLHRLTTHSLRHWFITKIWRMSKDPVLTQKLARHQNFQITENYINLDREDEIQTLQKLFGCEKVR